MRKASLAMRTEKSWMHKSFSGSLLSRVIGDHRFNELTDFREIRRDRNEDQAGKQLIFAHGLTNWRVASTKKKQPLRSVASRSMSTATENGFS
jgi:hypothetical protein